MRTLKELIKEEKDLEISLQTNVFSKSDLRYFECSEEYINKVFELSNDRFYVCTRDYQDTDFAVGCVYSLRDWVGKALNWLYMDDSNTEQDWLIGDNIIDGIMEYWEIELEEILL